MSNSGNFDFNALSPEQQAEYKHRFPRAGYWVGILPTHPEFHGHERQETTGEQLLSDTGMFILICDH